MKVLTWNLNNRKRDSLHQVLFVTDREPDIVVLTEVHPSRIDLWREALKGYDVAHTTSVSERPRALLLASKDQKLCARKRLGGHVIRAQVGALTAVGAHIPNASNNGSPRKMHFLRYLAVQQGDPIIVAGDFNCPKSELPDGSIVGWGKPDQRSVEETLFKRFHDAFREQHGFEREEWSWIAQNGQRRRFDHVLYRGLRPTFAEYLDHQALSDHRALEVHFATLGSLTEIGRPRRS
jgi:exonuclease III